VGSLAGSGVVVGGLLLGYDGHLYLYVA